MDEYKLQFRPKISRRNAKKMIVAFARYGNHYHDVQFKSDADVERGFSARGIDFEQLAERCRDPQENVPFFENLIGYTVAPVGGATVSRVDLSTGETDLETRSPGKLVLYDYWATFDTAVKALQRAVFEASYSELQSAIVQGIASIEGYINYRAEVWNKRHSEDQLLDSKQDKVSFDDKIDNWLPKMTGGKRLYKGDQEWSHFRTLREIRDHQAIHPKMSGHSISFAELAEKINLFRTGIAGLLIRLHVLFNEKVPRVIIRAAYAPDVEVVTVNPK